MKGFSECSEAARKYKLVEGKGIVYIDTDFDAISAYETIKKHYPALQKSDAVICANDYEAMGAIGAFLEKRVLVGKDVALIGFGNMIDTVTSYIPLTTMDQRLKLIGIKAIQAINNLRKGIESGKNNRHGSTSNLLNVKRDFPGREFGKGYMMCTLYQAFKIINRNGL